jgi:protein-S-isoprenylcysteine O-methyltransferase Ste14
MLLPNWLTGWLAFPLIILVFVIRIPNEEEKMVNQFGEEYSTYMKRTGGLIPRFK